MYAKSPKPNAMKKMKSDIGLDTAKSTEPSVGNCHKLQDIKARHPSQRYTLQPEKFCLFAEIDRSYLSSKSKNAYSEYHANGIDSRVFESMDNFGQQSYRICRKSQLEAYHKNWLTVIPLLKSVSQICVGIILIMLIFQMGQIWKSQRNLILGLLEFPTSLSIIFVCGLWLLVRKLNIEIDLIKESERVLKKLRSNVCKGQVISKTDFDEVFYKNKYARFPLDLVNKLYLYLQTRIAMDEDLILMRDQTDIAYLTIRY
jgi:hypothetical protein